MEELPLFPFEKSFEDFFQFNRETHSFSYPPIPTLRVSGCNRVVTKFFGQNLISLKWRENGR